MKRMMMLTLLALSAAGMVFAQGINNRDQGGGTAPQRPSSEKTSVTGNLTIANGMIAIKKGDVTYLIPGLLRYAGFIDSLKDGAQATIEGFVRARQADSKTMTLIPLKLTIGGKEYELGTPYNENRMQQDQQLPRRPPPQAGNRGKFHGPRDHHHQPRQPQRQDRRR